jgi:hypothetical protein
MESGTNGTTCLQCQATKTRILRLRHYATAHAQHTCDGFGAKEHFAALWSVLECFVPPICGVVFPFGFCESLFLKEFEITQITANVRNF